MDNPAQLRIEVSRFWFFAYSSCRIDGPAHHSNRIDDHVVFSYYVYVVRIIVALSTASPSDKLQNMVQTFLFMQKDCNFLCKQFCYSSASTQDDVSISEHHDATCSGFPFVAEQVAHTCHCTAHICH
jgi:hypothetical protein